MTSMVIDRFHVAYDTPSDLAVAIDTTVVPLLPDAIAIALLDAGLDSHEHVCIAALDAPVDLAGGRPIREQAACWAHTIVSEAAAVGLGAPIGNTAVVRYRRHLDALVDAVVGLARGDHRRAWAWRLVGVLTGPHGWADRRTGASRPLDAVVPGLLDHVALLPAVLRAAVGQAPLTFSTDAWAVLATRWTAEQPTLVPTPATRHGTDDVATLREERTAFTPPDGSRATDPAGHGGPRGRVLLHGDAELLRRQLPADIWSSPAAAAVARLLLACGQPALAISARSVAGLLHGLNRATAPTEPEQTITASPHQGATVGSAAVASRPAGAADPQGPTPGDPAPLGSAWAGLLLVITIIDRLGIPASLSDPSHPLHDRGVPWVIDAAARMLTTATSEDPAVVALTGRDPSEPTATGTASPVASPSATAADPDGHDRTLVRALVRQIEAALRRRLDFHPDAPVSWVFDRPGRIVWRPGWMEVTFSLDTVDLRLRKAGLDLDPGWVWWLGAIVRYRYV